LLCASFSSIWVFNRFPRTFIVKRFPRFRYFTYYRKAGRHYSAVLTRHYCVSSNAVCIGLSVLAVKSCTG
jgi:hypothetical protein